jgi:FeS assembly protein IscX
MKKLTWLDAEDIGLSLYEAHPDTDPLTVRFTDLHKSVLALDDFEDDPAKSNEGKLEAIQMAWYEEWKDNQ